MHNSDVGDAVIAIDLFCGRGGWTNGLLVAGFQVYGFDINPQPEYKGIFVQTDILTMTVDDLRTYAPDFAVCSSPCEQFSVHCMKLFHPNPPYPEMGIRLFNHARMLLEELGVPYVMENVRCAEKFIGKAVNHCGPFYLWGNAVPAVFMRETYKLTKGGICGTGPKYQEMSATERRIARSLFPRVSGNRKRETAKVACIPSPIAQAVAEGARQLVELRAEAAQ